MSERERCGDYEIYLDDEGKWIVENSITKDIIGKFQSKNKALQEIASLIQSDEDRIETESVC